MRVPIVTFGLFIFAFLGMHGTSQAQVDLSGEWALRMHEDQPWRGPGQLPGEWQGLPINAEARAKAESWMASACTMPERQCIPFPVDMAYTFGNMRIWKVKDAPSQELTAFGQHNEWQAQERTIWMDGRPHPPNWAPHTWQGFSTGEWVGNMLKVTTTHLKMAYLERNGVPRSDEATVVDIDLAIPRDKQEGGTYIIPGHGRVSDEADVVEYRDMLVIINDRVQDLLKKGRTLDQITATKPTFDYDRRYSTPGWTGDQLVESIVATRPAAPRQPSGPGGRGR